MSNGSESEYVYHHPSVVAAPEDYRKRVFDPVTGTMPFVDELPDPVEEPPQEQPTPAKKLDPRQDPTLERFPCDFCGQMLTRKSMNSHRRRAHKAYGRPYNFDHPQSLAVPIKRGRPPGSPNKPKVENVKTPEIVPVPPPATNGVLRSEEIVRTAAAWLWKDGTPHNHLEAVLRWHSQTSQFLDEVQGVNGH